MADRGRRGFLFGAGCLSAMPGVTWARAPDDDFVTTGEAGVVGAGALVVRTGAAPVVTLYGRTRASGGRTLFANDRWHIGSNTKAMTAALYARLAEQGRCRWGASVAELFTDIEVATGWADVPVEALMSHTAGLTDAAIDGNWLRARHADRTDVRVQRTRFAQALLSRPAAGRGTYAYGNAGYMLIGAAIERATGSSWEDTMRAELFAPLELTSAGFGAPDAVGPWGHAAGPVAVDPRGIADNPAVMGPAGRVHLTLGDYASFLSLYLDESAGFLAPATIARLLKPAAGPYAGGWMLGTGARGSTLTHEGSNGLWHVVARLFPGAGVGYVAAVNQGGAPGRAAAMSIIERLQAG